MKPIIIISICLIFTTSIYGQNYTLSELIKINNYVLDEFDTYVTQKGYKYYKSDSTEFSESTSYAYTVNGINKSYISKYYRKLVNNEMVDFQTSDNTIYLKIKSELKMLGFKFVKTGTFQGGTYFDYIKGKIEVSLTSLPQEVFNGNKSTIYEIAVTTNY